MGLNGEKKIESLSPSCEKEQHAKRTLSLFVKKKN